MILYFRNDKEDKAYRFILIDDLFYREEKDFSFENFNKMAVELAEEWGFPIPSTEEEWKQYQ